MRAHFFFVELDDAVQGCRVDVALLNQQGLQSTHPHIHLAQMGVVMIVVVSVGVIARVVWRIHGRMIGQWGDRGR